MESLIINNLAPVQRIIDPAPDSYRDHWDMAAQPG